jgi:hypothetical protein
MQEKIAKQQGLFFWAVESIGFLQGMGVAAQSADEYRLNLPVVPLKKTRRPQCKSP